jgi:rifampin ADP-ribosylating transferase
VELTGDVEAAFELTGQEAPGNPTMSCRSREPLRVMGEVTEWQGHSAEAIEAMKAGLERLDRLGIEPLDD